MNGLIRTLPVSPPPLVALRESNSGSVDGVRAPNVTPLTGRGRPQRPPRAVDERERARDDEPAAWLACVAITGVFVTGPTNAPAGIPVPVTVRPSR